MKFYMDLIVCSLFLAFCIFLAVTRAPYFIFFGIAPVCSIIILVIRKKKK